MILPKKVAVMVAGALTAVSLASIAQDPAAPATADQKRQIVVGGAIDWIEKSDVSALKEGTIADIEILPGRRVKKGDEIGRLDDKMAALTEAKARLAANNTGDIEKAEAQKKLALATVSRFRRLALKNAHFVSVDETEKAEAELAVAVALTHSAEESQKLAKADYDLAVQSRAEHRIVAPFDGVITDQMKHRSESVRANEAVVRVGRTDKLKFVGWVSLETAFRIKGNEPVDVRPVIDGTDLPIESQKFRGKITAIASEINSVTNARVPEVQVFAEIDNPENPEHPELMLRQGMKAEMTIYVEKAPAKVAAAKP
jgi:RND family efflux transporter MFP subunit